MGRRRVQTECNLCDGVIDWGYSGSGEEEKNEPTCTCVVWLFDETSGRWVYKNKKKDLR
jgi:hypothetical protein